jgi:hypothetical protein
LNEVFKIFQKLDLQMKTLFTVALITTAAQALTLTAEQTPIMS